MPGDVAVGSPEQGLNSKAIEQLVRKLFVD